MDGITKQGLTGIVLRQKEIFDERSWDGIKQEAGPFEGFAYEGRCLVEGPQEDAEFVDHLAIAA